jgi:tryptophan-rich sensory protein
MQYGASMALSCILKAMRLTIAHFRPDSSLSEWYERDIKPGWHRLRNLRVEIAEREAPPDGR